MFSKNPRCPSKNLGVLQKTQVFPQKPMVFYKIPRCFSKTQGVLDKNPGVLQNVLQKPQVSSKKPTCSPK
jgi:hypothetical protein